MKTKGINETEIQIICVYLTQMLGQSTPKKIREVMKDKMDLKCNLIEITNALNSAKKRGILSALHLQDPETEKTVDGYSMKDVRFANPPEIAHIKNVLPKLLEDEATTKMFSEMENVHDKGDKKGGRLPDIRDYVTYHVTFKNITPILGGQPAGIKEESQAKNVFRRMEDGRIWMPGNLWLRATIRDRLREYNINESKILYVHINDFFFNPKRETIEVVCPSPPQRKGGPGTGLVTYEGLQPGEILVFTIKFPVTNGISEDVMQQLLADGLHLGARSKDYGVLELVKIDKK